MGVGSGSTRLDAGINPVTEAMLNILQCESIYRSRFLQKVDTAQISHEMLEEDGGKRVRWGKGGGQIAWL